MSHGSCTCSFQGSKMMGTNFQKILFKKIYWFLGVRVGGTNEFSTEYIERLLWTFWKVICQYEIKCNRYWTFPVLLQNYIPTQVLSSTLHAESKHKLFPSLILLKRPEGTAGYRPWKVCYCNLSDRRISFPKLWIHPKLFFW